MKLNAIVLILIAGMFLAVIVIAQTTPLVAVNNESNQSANLTEVNTTQGAYVEGELLVQFNPAFFPTAGALEVTSMQANAAIGAVRIKTFYGSPGLEHIQLPPGMNVDQGKAYYLSIPTVRFVDVNAIYSIANTPEQGNGTISPTPAGNNSAGDIYVQYNATAYPSPASLQMYANSTNAAINATLVTDYTIYGAPGLQLVNLQNNMTPDQGIAYYRNVTNVLYAEPNIQYSAVAANQTANQTRQ
ncbi:MAG: hypothetical protein CVV33_08630 [Methanomicrobiales archaeon HGW-Methanomicrobiales-4]|nr:MAG: hypothetical protein CVV33_08630 [Methanomicrobiales archaeon HGW-Methanomicrobiales-4]